MQIGLGILCWSPKEFWNSTCMELYAALEGYNEKQTGEQQNGSSSQTMTKDELAEMMERFPDRV